MAMIIKRSSTIRQTMLYIELAFLKEEYLMNKIRGPKMGRNIVPINQTIF